MESTPETPALRAVIIDDEPRARNTLATLLRDYCPGVELVAACANVPEGVLAINKHHADLVFLDVEMPEYNGFELPGFFRELDFAIIFVTAYQEHARRAFEVSATDYLLKPVEIGQLQAAVDKARQRHSVQDMKTRLEIFAQAFQDGSMTRIALTVQDGVVFVEVAQLVLMEAEGAYTRVQLQDGSSMLVSRKLRFFEEVLEARPCFARPHRSFVVNLNHAKRYSRGESLILMDTGTAVPISRERKADFEQRLRDLRIVV